jgi:ligand-binding sensor domain-containing protein
MFLHEGSAFHAYPTEADALLRKAQPYSCSALPDGGLVVTTLRGGAVLLTSEAKLERVLNENSGLASDSVTFAYPDREGGLWLAMVTGVARVAARSPLSVLDERNGLAESLRRIARQDGTLCRGPPRAIPPQVFDGRRTRISR